MTVPAIRVTVANDAPLRPQRGCVVYWMIAARRTRWNFGLQRAVEAAVSLGKPLVVLEPLRCDYPFASERLHRFVMDGMRDNARRCGAAGIDYVAYVEPEPGAGRGLLRALAAEACLVVTDDFPCFFLPAMVAAAARQLDVRLERVDSNGLLPIRDAEEAFPTALAFRRHLQKRLPRHLPDLPDAEPLAAEGLVRARAVPAAVARRWRSAGENLSRLPIDHDVPAVAGARGGRPPWRRSRISWSGASSATAGRGTSRRRTRRAGCPPICTSATSPAMSSSWRSPRWRVGRAPISRRSPPAGGRAGGG